MNVIQAVRSFVSWCRTVYNDEGPGLAKWDSHVVGNNRRRLNHEAGENNTGMIAHAFAIASRHGPPFQMIIVMESLCLFHHAMVRLAERPSSELLKQVLVDVTAPALAHHFAAALRSQRMPGDTRALVENIIAVIAEREHEYRTASRLVSDGRDDKDSAIWLAATHICESTRMPDCDKAGFATQLTEALDQMDLQSRVARIESCLS
jgi:hypothetical protein